RQDRKSFLALAQVLADTQWGDARAYFKAGPKVLSRIDKGERGRFLSMADRIARLAPHLTLPFALDGSRAVGQAEMALHPKLLRLDAELLAVSCPCALEFLKSSPAVLSRIRSADLDRWFREGAQLLEENEEAAIAYFRLESSRSEKALEKLSAGMELGKVREVLRMYCKALTGRNVHILLTQNLTEKGIGWVSQEQASTEGSAVFLPSFVERFGAKEDNFGWYKVIATHQSAHLEFGSFDFTFQRKGPVFPSLRFDRLAPQGRQPLADLERFFDLFPDRKLASDLFTVVEDARVDFNVKREYQGLKPLYQRMQSDALTQRPPLPSLPLREAFLEVLVRLSLDDNQTITVPHKIRAGLREGTCILRQVQSSEALVEDSAEAVLRLYE
ncbi:MAG: hypothetical protein Q8O76_02100, partial [Chloroflexota bacterium]|nr:hypothetical protein [Chloroflexota bacterium]